MVNSGLSRTDLSCQPCLVWYMIIVLNLSAKFDLICTSGQMNFIPSSAQFRPHPHKLHITNEFCTESLISTCTSCNTTRILSAVFHPWCVQICSNKWSEFHSTALTAFLIQCSASLQRGWCLTVHINSKTVAVKIKFPGVTTCLHIFPLSPCNNYHLKMSIVHNNNYITNLQPRMGFWSYSFAGCSPWLSI